MIPYKLAVINPVKVLFTEHLSNGLQLGAIAGVAAFMIGGVTFIIAHWVF
jgi:hypothetical protein